MSSELQSKDGLDYLGWLARNDLEHLALRAPSVGPDGMERRAQAVADGTHDLSDYFICQNDDIEIRRRWVEQYRTLNALGIGVVLTIAWDGRRLRVLQTLAPDGRYSTEISMGQELRHAIPLAMISRRLENGFSERSNLFRGLEAQNHALVTGQLVGNVNEQLNAHLGEIPSGQAHAGVSLDGVLEAITTLSEPLILSIVANPLPPAYLNGALDFLFAATSACASGAEVTMAMSSSTSDQNGTSELDPNYRKQRATIAVAGGAAGMIGWGAAAAGLAATVFTGGLAAPLVLAAGAGLQLASRIDWADLAGWKAQVQVSRTSTTSEQTTRKLVDERRGFYGRKLRELTEMFERGGGYGLWNWYAAVSARSSSVCTAVSEMFASRLAPFNNSLEPLRIREVALSETEAVDTCLDHGLVPAIVQPRGLLGNRFGSVAQSESLPFLFAPPTSSHAGIRVIKHLPVTWTDCSDDESVALGRRPDSRDVPVEMSLANLTRHALICGRTGSGKTCLLRSILRQGVEHGIPFVFLDMAQPIESSSWSFAKSPLFYEAGRSDLGESFPSLGMLDHGRPSEYDHHVWQISDLLSNWLPSEGPLPLLFTELLHEANKKHVDSDGNFFSHGDPSCPTFSELTEHIDDLFTSTGDRERYEGELRSNLWGALVTRLKRLDTRSMRELLEGTASGWIQALEARREIIASLASSGSTNERCFVALVFLLELRQWLRETRERTEHGKPRIFIALDEAHILLRKTPTKSQGTESNIHAYAVRWFDELMAEIRQLGASVIVVDQSPSLLADSVLFSTGNKVVFTLASGMDMKVIGESLALPKERHASFGTLPDLLAYVKPADCQDLAILDTRYEVGGVS